MWMEGVSWPGYFKLHHTVLGLAARPSPGLGLARTRVRHHMAGHITWHINRKSEWLKNERGFVVPGTASRVWRRITVLSCQRHGPCIHTARVYTIKKTSLHSTLQGYTTLTQAATGTGHRHSCWYSNRVSSVVCVKLRVQVSFAGWHCHWHCL